MVDNSDLNLNRSDSNSDTLNLNTHQDSTKACKKKKMVSIIYREIDDNNIRFFL